MNKEFGKLSTEQLQAMSDLLRAIEKNAAELAE
jgi:hypothetical protein